MTNQHSTKVPATAEKFAEWEARAAAATDAAIAFTIADCAAAARAVRDTDSIAEGVYLDEMHTYNAERLRRAVRS